MDERVNPSLGGRRLLVVEDDYLIAIELAGALEDYGARIVGMAGSVKDARALIETEGDQLDGAVLDVNLDGDRVYPIADALLALGIPFVFATGYDLWVIPAVYAGVPRCEKPIRVSLLSRLLAEQIAGDVRNRAGSDAVGSGRA
jgi:CheY-like chemotaxis protein